MGVSLPDRTLIKQPVNQDLRVESGVLQLAERWKGQYLWCQDVAKGLYALSAVPYSQFTTNAGTLSAAYTTATPPAGYSWWFAQATVDECDAGENGFLQIIWNAMPTNQFDGNFEDWPVTETWNLEWQPENYDVYAYCKNPAEHQVSAENGSQRTAVEMCLNPPFGAKSMTMANLYQNNAGVVEKLNPNEQKILKWKLEGKHVIKHHPLLTQVKTWSRIPDDKVDLITSGVYGEVKNPDIIDTPGVDFLSGYTWVCQGSNVQTIQPDIKKNEYQVTLNTSWIGALSVVQEFYGNDNTRWEFGQM